MFSQNQIESSGVYQQPATTGPNWSNTNDWATSTTTPYNTNYYAPQSQYSTTYYPSHVSAASNFQLNNNESSINANDSIEFSSDKSVNNPASNKEVVTENLTSPINNVLVNKVPAYFTTQKICTNTAKLSYTTYQLQLLNAIYIDMKYPNSVQKTLIAKLIGITRDQVKIWFQNRRRKDTLVQQGKMPTIKNSKRRRSSEESEANDEESSLDEQKPVVGEEVIQGVLYQLKIHHNAPSRLSTKRARHDTEPEVKSAKKTCSDRIIVASHSDIQAELKLAVANTNTILTPVSSSSSSSSASSSSEEEVYNQPEVKFNTLSQPISMQDYIGSRYLASSTTSATIHQGNQYQQQQAGSCYQTNGLKVENKLLNSWAFQPIAYQANYYKPAITDTVISDYEAKNAYTQNYGYSTSAPEDYYNMDFSTGYQQYNNVNNGEYYGRYA